MAKTLIDLNERLVSNNSTIIHQGLRHIKVKLGSR